MTDFSTGHSNRGPCKKNGGLRLQYRSLKRQSGGALLMMRMGDHYVLFYEDAKKAAKALKVGLTPRGGKIDSGPPQCYVPLYAQEVAIQILTQKGHRVAICDQATNRPEDKGPMAQKAA